VSADVAVPTAVAAEIRPVGAVGSGNNRRRYMDQTIRL
jgi:hypothetical protein